MSVLYVWTWTFNFFRVLYLWHYRLAPEADSIFFEHLTSNIYRETNVRILSWCYKSYLRTLAIPIISHPTVRRMLHADFTFHTTEGSGFRIHGPKRTYET